MGRQWRPYSRLCATGGLHTCSLTGRLPACPPACPVSLVQVLRELPALEVADLSFNIYMEAASSLLHLMDSDTHAAGSGLDSIRRLDLRHAARRCGDGTVCWVEQHAVVPDADTHAAGRGQSAMAVAPARSPCAVQTDRLCPCCRKMLGVWKESSIKWLQELQDELDERHADSECCPSARPLVVWD